MNISRIENPEAKFFIKQFLGNAEINKEVYERIPEDKLDFRMVDTPERKSDSPRESIAHQVDTLRDYINGVKNGEVKFNVQYSDLKDLAQYSKKQLLDLLDNEIKNLINLLSDPAISNKKVKVVWSNEPVPAITCLWALDSHEILHTGWNLAIMDHLGIERFPKLKEMWG